MIKKMFLLTVKEVCLVNYWVEAEDKKDARDRFGNSEFRHHEHIDTIEQTITQINEEEP